MSYKKKWQARKKRIVALKDSTWIKKKDLPPLPPKEEWGSRDLFKQYQDNGKPRCQNFSYKKLKLGLRGVAAQCTKTATVGIIYCNSHDKTSKRRKVYTMEEEIIRYRKHMPKDFLVRFLEAYKDPDKLNLAVEVDLLTARIGEIFERLDTKQSTVAWNDIILAERMLRDALKNNDPTGIREGILLISNAVKSSDHRVWGDLLQLIQHRKSLVESENRRIQASDELLTLQEMMGLIVKTQQIIFEVIEDDKARLMIADRMRRELLAPDATILPDPTRGGHQVSAESFRGRDDFGCNVCQNQGFRERNTDKETSTFKCPSCGVMWDKERLYPKIVEGTSNVISRTGNEGVREPRKKGAKAKKASE